MKSWRTCLLRMAVGSFLFCAVTISSVCAIEEPVLTYSGNAKKGDWVEFVADLPSFASLGSGAPTTSTIRYTLTENSKERRRMLVQVWTGAELLQESEIEIPVGNEISPNFMLMQQSESKNQWTLTEEAKGTVLVARKKIPCVGYQYTSKVDVFGELFKGLRQREDQNRDDPKVDKPDGKITFAIMADPNAPLLGIVGMRMKGFFDLFYKLNDSSDFRDYYNSYDDFGVPIPAVKGSSGLKVGDWVEFTGTSFPKNEAVKMRHSVVSVDKVDVKIRVDLDVAGRSLGAKEYILDPDGTISGFESDFLQWLKMPEIGSKTLPRTGAFQHTLFDGRRLDGNERSWKEDVPDAKSLELSLRRCRAVPLSGLFSLAISAPDRSQVHLTLTADSGVGQRLLAERDRKYEQNRKELGTVPKSSSEIWAAWKVGDWIEYEGVVTREQKDAPKPKTKEERAAAAKKNTADKVKNKIVLRHTITKIDSDQVIIATELKIGGKKVGESEIILSDLDNVTPDSFLPPWEEFPKVDLTRKYEPRRISSGIVLKDKRKSSGELFRWDLKLAGGEKGEVGLRVQKGKDIPLTGLTSLSIFDGKGLKFEVDLSKDNGVIDRHRESAK